MFFLLYYVLFPLLIVSYQSMDMSGAGRVYHYGETVWCYEDIAVRKDNVLLTL